MTSGSLTALLAALRGAKLRIGVTEVLRLQHVLRLQPDLDRARLGSLIASLVVRSKEERETFDRIFGAWFEAGERSLETPLDHRRQGAALPARAPTHRHRVLRGNAPAVIRQRRRRESRSIRS